jgi:hypothetical protein
MFFREIFLPPTQVAVGFGHLLFTQSRPDVTRDGKLADLQLSIRDRAARDARVGRPMESTVENILTPAVRVVLVDVVNATISDHDFVGRG